ncbi:hypothetical protein EYF80_052649 [Liparis tanakae]|uniref:Uncharacterized protein n=1 Tax=Liparis tanakae TaxID=230148 RepID=A0A4Z2F7K8_9TELE|nr:hypothetical protein EYF80_052649 [Liparis tanakae]
MVLPANVHAEVLSVLSAEGAPPRRPWHTRRCCVQLKGANNMQIASAASLLNNSHVTSRADRTRPELRVARAPCSACADRPSSHAPAGTRTLFLGQMNVAYRPSLQFNTVTSKIVTLTNVTRRCVLRYSTPHISRMKDLL